MFKNLKTFTALKWSNWGPSRRNYLKYNILFILKCVGSWKLLLSVFTTAGFKVLYEYRTHKYSRITLSIYSRVLSPSVLIIVPQRVMMQIVQELCKRPGLNKCGFDMPTIYVPNPNKVSVVALSLSFRWVYTSYAHVSNPSTCSFWWRVYFVMCCLSFLFSAKPLCKPDWGGVSHRGENH